MSDKRCLTLVIVPPWDAKRHTETMDCWCEPAIKRCRCGCGATHIVHNALVCVNGRDHTFATEDYDDHAQRCDHCGIQKAHAPMGLPARTAVNALLGMVLS